ncbi:Uncharacterized protein dnm_036370 [Desulfonema magnum]|uniref:Uncharacterized protein n=1 Tax=Desulfonema magnum TaxID=45655 RepID=A0A975BKX4_9BACT|nr:Uncharacterized protein dnm_036370 [Desulfonema magnum]
MQKFYFCTCEKAFFALRKNSPPIKTAALPRLAPAGLCLPPLSPL